MLNVKGRVVVSKLLNIRGGGVWAGREGFLLPEMKEIEIILNTLFLRFWGRKRCARSANHLPSATLLVWLKGGAIFCYSGHLDFLVRLKGGAICGYFLLFWGRGNTNRPHPLSFLYDVSSNRYLAKKNENAPHRFFSPLKTKNSVTPQIKKKPYRTKIGDTTIHKKHIFFL